MNEHLPECLMNLEYAVRVCICTELRACEQRVLDAARKAVLALPKGGMGQKAHSLWRDAVAAIDALREEPPIANT